MNTSGNRLLAGAVAIVAAVFALTWLTSVSFTMRFDVYLLASFVLSIDMLDLLIRLHLRRAHAATALGPSIPLEVTRAAGLQAQIPLRPYALVFAVHDLEGEVDVFVEHMAPYRDRIWIIDDCSTDHTSLRLRAAGWRCLRTERNCKKPAALKRLLEYLPGEIHTVMVLDPDTVIRSNAPGTPDHLDTCIREFQASGAAALCPRVRLRPDGLLVSLQQLEYALSFCLGRKCLADLSITAGVALYRRDALEKTLAAHSLSVYAEDLENTLLLLGGGERIYYDDRLSGQTEGKRTFASWFSQRVGWWFGFLKVYVERQREVWTLARRSPMAFYHFVVYMAGRAVAAWPLKAASLLLLLVRLLNGCDELLGTALIPDTPLTSPLLFAVVYVKYLLLMSAAVVLVVPARERAGMLAVAPLYFFYALIHLAPMVVGFVNWLCLWAFGRRLYADHYDAEPRLNGLRHAA